MVPHTHAIRLSTESLLDPLLGNLSELPPAKLVRGNLDLLSG